MIDTEEDTAPPRRNFKELHKTDAQESKLSKLQQSYNRKPSCPGPLSQELDTTPPPKRLIKPLALVHHIFKTLPEEFKQAFLDDETEDIKAILNQYDLYGTTCLDFFKLTAPS